MKYILLRFSMLRWPHAVYVYIVDQFTACAGFAAMELAILRIQITRTSMHKKNVVSTYDMYETTAR